MLVEWEGKLANQGTATVSVSHRVIAQKSGNDVEEEFDPDKLTKKSCKSQMYVKY